MSFSDVLYLVPGQLALSLFAWFVLLTLLLYFARTPAHHTLLSLTRVMARGFRATACSVSHLAIRLNERNREVLLSEGREAAEHIIEREFERIDAIIRRDLAEYPALQRRLSELMTRIDDEYTNNVEVPPSPPGWVKAVEAIAEFSNANDPVIVEILNSIKESLNRAHERAIEEYRESSRLRHRILKRMRPDWRRLQTTLDQVNKHVDSLLLRTQAIDRHMDEYEQIMAQTDKAARTLGSSSLTQFFIAGFVLAIAIGGAVINFNLIARPMQEMVGGNSYLLGFRVADIAALVIILVEAAMGLFLMECMRITRLFPTIGALDDKLRLRMLWASLILLVFMASIEAGLAYMRELLAQDDAALVAGLLSGEAAAEAGSAENRWITTAAQMGMGFILPFALTFVAIPLESFIHSSRTVLGTVSVGLLRAVGFMLRLLSSITRHLGTALINMYDVLIFAPLWLEGRLKSRAVRSVPAPIEVEEKEMEEAA